MASTKVTPITASEVARILIEELKKVVNTPNLDTVGKSLATTALASATTTAPAEIAAPAEIVAPAEIAAPTATNATPVENATDKPAANAAAASPVEPHIQCDMPKLRELIAAFDAARPQDFDERVWSIVKDDALSHAGANFHRIFMQAVTVMEAIVDPINRIRLIDTSAPKSITFVDGCVSSTYTGRVAHAIYALMLPGTEQKWLWPFVSTTGNQLGGSDSPIYALKPSALTGGTYRLCAGDGFVMYHDDPMKCASIIAHPSTNNIAKMIEARIQQLANQYNSSIVAIDKQIADTTASIDAIFDRAKKGEMTKDDAAALGPLSTSLVEAKKQKDLHKPFAIPTATIVGFNGVEW